MTLSFSKNSMNNNSTLSNFVIYLSFVLENPAGATFVIREGHPMILDMSMTAYLLIGPIEGSINFLGSLMHMDMDSQVVIIVRYDYLH